MRKILTITTLLLGFVLLFLALRFHLVLLMTESPQEYRENTFVALTDFMVVGGIPYTEEAMPAYMNVYGIAYPAIVYPFAKIFGSTYALHRIVNAFFLFLALYVVYRVLRRENLDRMKSLFLVVIWYTTFLLTIFDVLSRSDGFGIFLYMTTLAIPWWSKFSNKSLILAVVTTVLSFYTKQYFVLGGIFLALYIFLFLSKKKSLIFSAGASCLFLTSAILIHIFMPYYFFNTILFHLKNARYLTSHLILQIQEFSYLNFGLIFLMAMFAGWKVATIRKIQWERFFPVPKHLFDWKKGVFQIPLNYWTVLLAFSVIVVVGKFGGHDGNFLSYFVELIGPLLIIVTALVWKQFPNKAISGLCIAGTLCILIARTSQFGIEDKKSIDDNWTEWKGIINVCNDVYVPGPFARIAHENGSKVYDAGHGEYFTKPITKFMIPTFPDPRPVFNAYLHELERKITGKEFDCIVRIKNYASYDYLYTGHLSYFIGQNYDLIEVKPLKMYYHQSIPFEVWKRK